MKVSAYHSRRGGRGGLHHVADILPAASKGTFLPFVIDADEKGLSAESTRTIIVLKALSIVL